MTSRATPYEYASALGHGHVVPAESLDQVRAILAAYGGDAGDVIVHTLRCEPGCACGARPSYELEAVR